MASTEDGAHQPPNDLHAENMVPQGNLDVSSWWTALQDDSILASADADSLQHIFSRLKLFEAMPLGFTCRRMYYYFKESQKMTKALNLTIGRSRPSLELLAPTEDIFVRKYFSSVALQFTATYASLRSLTVSTTTHPNNLATLLTLLPALPLLTTLNLQVTICDHFMSLHFRIETRDLPNFWPFLAQLQHPALRHLTLNLDAKSYDLFEIPPLHISRQLTSFTVVYLPLKYAPNYSALHKVIEALRKEDCGVHLIPGVGACIELTLFKKGRFYTVSIEPEILLFITFLNVTIRWSDYSRPSKPVYYKPALASLFRCLPQMRNLAKIELYADMSLIYADYPSLLSAVSSLPLLEELSLGINWEVNSNYNPPIVWPVCTALPVLRRVRRLSLLLSSNDDHEINLVEKLHLMHCFPELQQLCCRFNHRSACNCKNINGPQYAICGQKLARGLLELLRPEKRIVKRIEFEFDGKFYFSSLEELMAESRRKEQMTVASRLLADREGECAQLRATIELLKAQLAQTDAALREAKTQAASAEWQLKVAIEENRSLLARQLLLEENVGQAANGANQPTCLL